MSCDEIYRAKLSALPGQNEMFWLGSVGGIAIYFSTSHVIDIEPVVPCG